MDISPHDRGVLPDVAVASAALIHAQSPGRSSDTLPLLPLRSGSCARYEDQPTSCRKSGRAGKMALRDAQWREPQTWKGDFRLLEGRGAMEGRLAGWEVRGMTR